MEFLRNLNVSLSHTPAASRIVGCVTTVGTRAEEEGRDIDRLICQILVSAQLLVMTVWDQSAHLNSGACQLQCHTAEYVANGRISTLHKDAVSSTEFIQRRLSLYHVTALFHLYSL